MKAIIYQGKGQRLTQQDKLYIFTLFQEDNTKK